MINNKKMDNTDKFISLDLLVKSYSKSPNIWIDIIKEYGDGYIQHILDTPYSIMYCLDNKAKPFIIIGEKTIYSDFDNESEGLYTKEEILNAINHSNTWNGKKVLDIFNK